MSFTNPSAALPTKYGNLNIIVWPEDNGKEAVALTTPQLDPSKPVTVRVHSECMTGDVFGSLRCDCGQQKQRSLQQITKSQNGVFIYLQQEGRGIGLSEKIRAYALQEQGYDTHEANILLGHEPDPREYTMVKVILEQLGITDIKLITNNPSKENSLRAFGFNIVERIPLRIQSNKYNKKYLETKKVKFKHFDNGSNNYFYGVTGVQTVENIEFIASHIKSYNLDPFLRIALGIPLNNSIFADEEKKKHLEVLFKTVLKYHPPLVPVLHYTFKNSKPKDYKNEIEQLHKEVPFFKKILLNDLEKDYLEVLSFATKFYLVHFPINDKLLHLVSDPKYSKIARAKKVLTILDNSGGKGVSENIASFERKITMCLNNNINDIGLAGGFGQDNLETFHQLKHYFKINFSIDAETRLKENGTLSHIQAETYLDQLLNPEKNKPTL